MVAYREVQGVCVGQVEVHEGEDVHTGVTVILPRGIRDTTLVPCYAAVHDMNSIGEWTGLHQIREWGYTRAVSDRIALIPTVFVDSTAHCFHKHR